MTKTIRFLATGDLQVHNWSQFNYTRPDGMGSRLYYTLKVFDILLEKALELGIDKVLLNGDIMEDNSWIDVEVFDAVYQKLERMHRKGLDIVINLGNHDVCRATGERMLHSLRPFRKVAQVIERPTIIWGCLGIIPWTPDVKEFKSSVKQMVGIASGLACHQGIQGATTGPKKVLINNPIQLADLRPKKFNLILLSDYHSTQRLAHNVLYMGSPIQHSFGETHFPQLCDVRLGGKPKWQIWFIPTNLPRMYPVKLLDEGDFSNLKNLFRRKPGNYFKVELPPDSKLHPSDIEAVAQKYKCQVQIVHTADERVSLEQTEESVDLLEHVKAYVKIHAKHSKRKLLSKLGQKLLEREP